MYQIAMMTMNGTMPGRTCLKDTAESAEPELFAGSDLWESALWGSVIVFRR